MPRRQQGEGSVYHRRARGQWVAVADLGIRGGRRDRREFTATTKDAALAKRARFLHARYEGFTLPRGRQPYVSEWVLHWLQNTAKPKIDPNTYYRSYRQKCEDYIVPFFARIPLPELAEEDIEDWHRHLAARLSRRGTPLSAGTILTAHRILSASLNVAVARRRLPHNPAALVHPPKGRHLEPQPPTAEEVRVILAACRDRPGGARWILAICTGLRQGEALALQWRDVRLDRPASVTVRQSAARVGGQLVTKAPKSEKSRRTVPLPKIAVDALRVHRATAVRNVSNDLVFTGAEGRPVHSRADWQDWADLLADLGLPRCRVHDLRHGFATMLLEGGADPRLVQDLMGHSTTALLAVYQHVRPAMHERAVSILDEMLGER